MTPLSRNPIILDLYNSGVYEEAKSSIISVQEGFPFYEDLIKFGEGRDDNFKIIDIHWALRIFPTPNHYDSNKSLALEGDVMRGWFSSTFHNFILHFKKELRDITCKDGKADNISKASDITATGIITGLSTWICSEFRVSNPTAIGISTAVLMTLFYATKGAFCKMTDEELKKSLTEKLDTIEKGDMKTEHNI